MLNYDQSLELATVSQNQVQLRQTLTLLTASGFHIPADAVRKQMADNTRRLSELYELAREEVTTTESQTSRGSVVVVGNPVDGINIVGPFPSIEDAHDYAEGLDEPWIITGLESPKEDE